ncbi:MAG: tRNA (guanosine(37)-N1)-methyltransferase TrmD [Bdellovibrio sp.]|nr:tRNA (guanosine(37)-N1)-methyltransferase TrmD [Bdellovibrio sp.]
MFEGFLNKGLIGTALSGHKSLGYHVHLVQIRNHAPNDYKGVDDSPFGGGPGMVMRADVLKNALIDGVVVAGGYGRDNFREQLKVILAGPRGRVWNSDSAKQFSLQYLMPETLCDIVFICGRYEGIDERFVQTYVDLELSLGDFILSGGELAVMAFLDSSLRYIPGVLGNAESAVAESFECGLLEQPQYTRPREFEGNMVPEILLSGHHEKVAKWQREQRIQLTQKHRPDLFQKYIRSQNVKGGKK